ncbi:MAG TPA: SGNH/GDSL hydrolase family protein [Chthoniobacterales bacterium]|nr:SGNH/GDSL hydrolase family protein [Chthoniobacterales bacterium]
MKKRFLSGVVLAALLFAGQETLFRGIFPLPEIRNFNRVNYSAFTARGQTATSFAGARRPAMNATVRWNSRPDGASYDIHLNLYGFRDRDWQLPPTTGRERVMFVGDSLVEGFMATDGETIPAGYARAAAQRRKPVEAMNFGVGGAGIDNYLRLMRDAVPLFRPHRIVVVIYANDLPYSLPNPVPVAIPLAPITEPSFRPRLLAVLGRVVQRQVVPRRWYARAALFVPVVPDPLNPWTDPPQEFAKIDPAIAEAMRRGDFNPFVVNLLNHARMALRQPVEPRPALKVMQEIAASAQAELHLVYLPLSTQVSDYYVRFQQKYAYDSSTESLMGDEYQLHSGSLATACGELGIPFLDLTPLLRKAETGGEHLYWNFDEHLRGASYLRVGATIEAWMASPTPINDLVTLN